MQTFNTSSLTLTGNHDLGDPISDLYSGRMVLTTDGQRAVVVTDNGVSVVDLS